jgi:hypothetical protein
VTSTIKKARSKKPALEVSAVPKKALTKKASAKQCVAKPAPSKELVRPPTVNPFPAEEISDLLDTHERLSRADSSAPHSRPVPPLRVGTIADSPENCNPICG